MTDVLGENSPGLVAPQRSAIEPRGLGVGIEGRVAGQIGGAGCPEDEALRLQPWRYLVQRARSLVVAAEPCQCQGVGARRQRGVV